MVRLLALMLLPASLLFQQPDAVVPEVPEVVPFACPTYDGVTLVGDFYPPGRGRNQRGPVVILLHPIGPGKVQASRHDFGSLPRQLQAEGLGVVAFDFRGYGQSQSVDPRTYWPANGGVPRAQRENPPEKIDCRDFKSVRDYAALAHDLIAVKVWLNGQNNQKTCNSHAIAVVGVEQSCLIGLIWAVNEQQDTNRPYDTTAVVNNRPTRFEGDDLVSVAWIGMSDRLSTDRVDATILQGWLGRLRDRKVQTFAAVTDADVVSRQFWDRSQSAIRSPREADAFKHTEIRRIKGTPLQGLKLVEHEAFGLRPALVQYLEDSLLAPNRDWEEHKGNLEPTAVNLRALGMP